MEVLRKAVLGLGDSPKFKESRRNVVQVPHDN